jgi:hypothetical protein
MLVTDKIYFTSTLIAAAGCEADTFRAWRNRNGLFPETAGGGKWNKFSVVDILVTALVKDFTTRGMAAQWAVDAAMKASPLIAAACGVELDERDFFFQDEMLRKIQTKIWPEKTLFPILTVTSDGSGGRPPTVRLLSSHDASEKLFGGTWITTAVHLGKFCRSILGCMLMFDAELEIDGKKGLRSGYYAHPKPRSKPKSEKQTPNGTDR